jgi:hypothetical protein
LSLSSALEEYLDEGNKPTPKPTTTATNNTQQQPTSNQVTQTNVGQSMQQFQQQSSFMQQPQQANNAALDFFSSIANERVNVTYNPTQSVYSQQPAFSAPQQQLTYPVQSTFTSQPQSFTTQPQTFTSQPQSFTSQPQQSFQALPAPTSTPSLQLPSMTGSANHNPFRSSTLVVPSPPATQQQSSLGNANPFRASTLPSLGHSSTPNLNTMNGLQPVASFNTGNPFSSQQPMTMSPTNLNHNPFSSQQQWGSSIF